MYNCARLYEKIVSIIRDAIIDCPDRQPIEYMNIHIFTSVSGVTGSGIFLDVCYILQQALANLRINYADICGYFFLPDVHYEKNHMDKKAHERVHSHCVR